MYARRSWTLCGPTAAPAYCEAHATLYSFAKHQLLLLVLIAVAHAGASFAVASFPGVDRRPDSIAAQLYRDGFLPFATL